MRLQQMFETSPAMRRYMKRSLWPLLASLPVGVVSGFIAGAAPPGLVWPRLLGYLLFVGLLLWFFVDYLRFLRECDELERRIEQLSLVWASGAMAICSALLVIAELLQLIDLDSIRALQYSWLAFTAAYVLARLGLMWRYA